MCFRTGNQLIQVRSQARTSAIYCKSSGAALQALLPSTPTYLHSTSQLRVGIPRVGTWEQESATLLNTAAKSRSDSPDLLN